MTWMTGTFDPGAQSALLGTGNPTPCSQARGRPATISTPLHRGLQTRYREARLVFFSPRHTTCTTGMPSRRRFCSTRSSRASSIASRAGQPNGFFFLLDRTNGSIWSQLRSFDQTWASRRRLPRPPIAKPEAAPSPEGALVETWFRRSQQLDGAKLLIPDRPVLCQCPPNLQHLLSHSHREAGRLGSRDRNLWPFERCARSTSYRQNCMESRNRKWRKYLRYSYNRRASPSSAPIISGNLLAPDPAHWQNAVAPERRRTDGPHRR